MVLRRDPQLPDGYEYTQPSFTSDGTSSVGYGLISSVKTLVMDRLGLLEYELIDSMELRLCDNDRSFCICFGCVVINFADYVLGGNCAFGNDSGIQPCVYRTNGYDANPRLSTYPAKNISKCTNHLVFVGLATLWLIRSRRSLSRRGCKS